MATGSRPVTESVSRASADPVSSVPDGLRCARCKGALRREGDGLACDAGCGVTYPMVRGVPVLIDPDGDSLFQSARTDAPVEFFTVHPVKRALKRLVPRPGVHLSDPAIGELTDLLRARGGARVLIVGGGDVGAGLRSLLDDPSFDVVESDVVHGLRTTVIMDAHEIPFADGEFDCCILQAVLEHVCDPHRVVEEVHRVLAPDGLVYAETPFMQQVHMGRYDFTRFTHLGHRRLFRRFESIREGVVAGTGTALVWSVERFLLSFTRSDLVRKGLQWFARVVFSPLKYLDHLTVRNPASYDGASGFYFLGRRSEATLSDRELIGLYRGADRRF